MSQLRRVLLVEDSPTDALMVKHALRRRFAVEHVLSPVAAQEALKGRDYAAVITDYYLPDMDGLAFQRWMRHEHSEVPVILMSGCGDERVATEALKQGAYDYVVKSEEALASMCVVLEQVLRRHDLERRANMLQQIVEQASDAIFTLDADGVLLTANRAISLMFGLAPDAAVGQPITALFPEAPQAFDPRLLLTAEEAESRWQGEITARRTDGTTFPAHVSCSVLTTPSGTKCLIGIARDVTERRQLLERLQRLSMTDNLTSLYNARFFYDRLRYEFARARRYGDALSCIMIDVDFFKAVNDTHGHLVGDEALREIAARLAASVRATDIAARYGGEEFAVLLPNTDMEGARECAEHIRHSVAHEGLATSAGCIRVTISAGVATLETGLRDESDLCRHADESLMAAKRRGRNNVQIWTGPDRLETGLVPAQPASAIALACLRQSAAATRARCLDILQPAIEAVCCPTPEATRRAEQLAARGEQLAAAAGLSPEEVDAIRRACLFHRIGTLPPAVHGKDDGPAGAVAASDIVAEFRMLNQECCALRHHHERYDGAGGPDGLAGERIPLGARILAVAEASCAHEELEVPQSLRREAGGRLDPRLVELFLRSRQKPPPTPVPHQTAAATP